MKREILRQRKFRVVIAKSNFMTKKVQSGYGKAGEKGDD